jgi:hypothetical protein
MEIPYSCLEPHLDGPCQISAARAAGQNRSSDISFQKQMHIHTVRASETADHSDQAMPALARSVFPSYAVNTIAEPEATRSLGEQIRIYREDQLLAHPGGDQVNLTAEDPFDATIDQRDFLERVGKDIEDAIGNAVNFFKDLFWGSDYRYVDEAGGVQTARRKGLLQNVAEFFKDSLSALSFGYCRPDGEIEPQGFWERCKFAAKKMFGEALLDDLIIGLPSSGVNLADDAALTLWNLLEVIPDATVGQIPQGLKLVSTVFDNGQVAIDYITDCLPTGEAWLRVHAYRLNSRHFVPPVLYNINLPERFSGDARWQTIRNTPFRKTIETVGSMLADFWLVNLTCHGPRTSKRRN